jgi:hypothetical protein
MTGIVLDIPRTSMGAIEHNSVAGVGKLDQAR